MRVLVLALALLPAFGAAGNTNVGVNNDDNTTNATTTTTTTTTVTTLKITAADLTEIVTGHLVMAVADPQKTSNNTDFRNAVVAGLAKLVKLPDSRVHVTLKVVVVRRLSVARHLTTSTLRALYKIFDTKTSAASTAHALRAATPAQLTSAIKAAIEASPNAASLKAAVGDVTVTERTYPTVEKVTKKATTMTTTLVPTTTMTAWDSSSSSSSGQSSGSLASVGSGPKASFNTGSSASAGSSLSGSSASSGSNNASGSWGSQLQVWQWILIIALCCCCGGGGAAAAMNSKKPKKKSTKKKAPAAPAPVPAAAPVAEPLLPSMPPLVPLATTSQPIPSYTRMAAPQMAAPAYSYAPTYAAPYGQVV